MVIKIRANGLNLVSMNLHMIEVLKTLRFKKQLSKKIARTLSTLKVNNKLKLTIKIENIKIYNQLYFKMDSLSCMIGICLVIHWLHAIKIGESFKKNQTILFSRKTHSKLNKINFKVKF